MAKKVKTPTHARTPDPTDVARGAKIRVRRIEQKMSQQDLAATLGVTFQQVQKYEKGTNRVSASRINDIATALDIDVSYFMEATSGRKSESGLMALVMDKTSQRLLQAFHKVKDGPMRYKIVGLVEAITAKAA